MIRVRPAAVAIALISGWSLSIGTAAAEADEGIDDRSLARQTDRLGGCARQKDDLDVVAEIDLLVVDQRPVSLVATRAEDAAAAANDRSRSGIRRRLNRDPTNSTTGVRAGIGSGRRTSKAAFGATTIRSRGTPSQRAISPAENRDTVTTRRADCGMALAAVADSGPGLAPAVADQLF